MAKYHINRDTGEAGLCRATQGGCPFGGEEAHHDDVATARAAYEKSMSENTVPTSVTREPRDADTELHGRLSDSYREYQKDPRTEQQQWREDQDKPLSDLNPNHPLVVGKFGSEAIVARERAIVENEIREEQEAEDRKNGIYHYCMDCGEPMEGYGPDEYPPDYCDMCEGDHEDEY